MREGPPRGNPGCRCAQERAAAYRCLRHFHACDTLPAGECEAAREFRARCTTLIGDPVSTFTAAHFNWIQGWEHFSTVIRAQSQARARVVRGRARGVSARRRCGPRAPGEWRAPAPPSVAPRWKVKVSGGRGARWHISPTFAAVIHDVPRSLPATPALRCVMLLP